MEIYTDSNPVDYDTAHDFMQDRVKKIRENSAPELIWLLEHNPVITLGSSYKGEITKSIASIPVKAVGRGGQATYHAPGQRIVYLMIDLKNRKLSVSEYMKCLRIWVVETLRNLGIESYHLRDPLGVWVDSTDAARPQKVAAFGVRVSRGVAWHGLAINVSLDLSPYQLFVPCGLNQQDYGVSSLNLLSDKEFSLHDIDQSLLNCLNVIFPDTDLHERKVI